MDPVGPLPGNELLSSTARPEAARLDAAWFAVAAETLARRLLGMRLVTVDRQRGLTSGRIVETEAYLPVADSACHAARGQTPGNRTMFGPPGRAYVYPIHSRVCFNVVCGEPGLGTAVLIRAVQPEDGVATMIRRRGTGRIADLCRGPGRLCQALGIGRDDDGRDLAGDSRIWIDRLSAVPLEETMLRRTGRIGVTSASGLELRFVIAGNPWASGPRRLR